MRIEYLGHSCFKLTESTGTSVITDPYSGVGYEMPKVSADIVTSSHNHYDHNYFKGVSGKPKVVSSPITFEEKGISITSVRSFHDDAEGKKRGENIIYKFRMDGIDICHLGDIGHECNSDLVELLLPVNVLLIPVGGNFTIDAEMAFEYVERLMPDIVIPMHYKTKSLDMDIDKVGEFLSMFEDEEVEELDTGSIEIDRKDLDSKSTRVIVLKRVRG